MEFQFKQAGGRLFRIALLFTLVCVLAIGVMVYFTHRAMADMKEIALSGDPLIPEVQSFYIQLIDNLKIGTVIGSLSGVLIAIAARYGFRETAQNIAQGLSARQPSGQQGGGMSEEVEAK